MPNSESVGTSTVSSRANTGWSRGVKAVVMSETICCTVSVDVTVQVAPQAPQLQELLARHLTPTRVQVEGVKSIPFDDVAQRFTPLVGKDTTIGDLIQVANGVTKLYQDRGYALSFAFIPAQTFEGGVVRVTVVEGYVSAVKVTGKPGA